MNRLVLSAQLIQMAAPRYTPAGIPVADVLLEHYSRQTEAGTERQVSLQLQGVAFGAVAEALRCQALGVQLESEGFLTHARNGKSVVFHIQAFKTI